MRTRDYGAAAVLVVLKLRYKRLECAAHRLCATCRSVSPIERSSCTCESVEPARIIQGDERDVAVFADFSLELVLVEDDSGTGSCRKQCTRTARKSLRETSPKRQHLCGESELLHINLAFYICPPS